MAFCILIIVLQLSQKNDPSWEGNFSKRQFTPIAAICWPPSLTLTPVAWPRPQLLAQTILPKVTDHQPDHQIQSPFSLMRLLLPDPPYSLEMLSSRECVLLIAPSLRGSCSVVSAFMSLGLPPVQSLS